MIKALRVRAAMLLVKSAMAMLPDGPLLQALIVMLAKSE